MHNEEQNYGFNLFTLLLKRKMLFQLQILISLSKTRECDLILGFMYIGLEPIELRA